MKIKNYDSNRDSRVLTLLQDLNGIYNENIRLREENAYLKKTITKYDKWLLEKANEGKEDIKNIINMALNNLK